MALPFPSLRRRLAEAIYPEMTLIAPRKVAWIDAQKADASRRRNDLIALGTAFARYHRASLAEALRVGFDPRDWSELSPADVRHRRAMHRISEAFERCLKDPNKGIREFTHRDVLDAFSSRWPDDLPWPSDIPRPRKSKKEAA